MPMIVSILAPVSAGWSALLTTPTGIIALWGAILGTISLAWNICRDLLLRANLKVTVDTAMIGSQGVGIVKDGLLRYIMVNKGHHPITVVNVGGAIKIHPTSATHFVCMHEPYGDQLPKTLGHSETVSVLVNDLSPLNNNLEALWVTDSTGRHWKASAASMDRLRADPEWGRHQPEQ